MLTFLVFCLKKFCADTTVSFEVDNWSLILIYKKYLVLWKSNPETLLNLQKMQKSLYCNDSDLEKATRIFKKKYYNVSDPEKTTTILTLYNYY